MLLDDVDGDEVTLAEFVKWWLCKWILGLKLLHAPTILSNWRAGVVTIDDCGVFSAWWPVFDDWDWSYKLEFSLIYFKLSYLF